MIVELVTKGLAETMKILLMVFVLMIVVEFFGIRYGEKIKMFARGPKQCVVASFPTFVIKLFSVTLDFIIGVTPFLVGL